MSNNNSITMFAESLIKQGYNNNNRKTPVMQYTMNIHLPGDISLPKRGQVVCM